jgi:hypothetical protein
MPAGSERVHDDFVVASVFAGYRRWGGDALFLTIGSDEDCGEDEEFFQMATKPIERIRSKVPTY